VKNNSGEFIYRLLKMHDFGIETSRLYHIRHDKKLLLGLFTYYVTSGWELAGRDRWVEMMTQAAIFFPPVTNREKIG